MIIKKTWGFEDIIVNTELYCLKRITINFGKTSSEGKFHYHKKKDETFIIESGSLILDVWNSASEVLRPGDVFRIKPNTKHRFTASAEDYGKCCFWEVSTHHEDSNSYYD